MLLVKLKIVAIFVLGLGITTGVVISGHYAMVQADDTRPDKERLQGKWEIVAAKMDGKEVEGKEAEQILKQNFVFDGDKLKAKEEATFTIYPAKKPKEIDLKVEVGPEQEQGIWKGIYEIKGDELKLCFGPPNGDRPADFDSTGAGNLKSEVMFFKLKRIK